MAIKFSWNHRQPEPGLVEVSEAGLARAAALDWSSEPMQVRAAHLRGLLVRSVADAAMLTTVPIPPAGSSSWTAPEGFDRLQYRSAWGPEVAEMLLRTPMLLLGSRGRPEPDAWQSVFTVGGAPARPTPGEAAHPLLIGAVVIVGAAAWTVAMVYTAQKTAEVIDNELSRRDSARKMIATQASVLRMLEQHTAAEIAAGKPLGLSVAESNVLDELLATQEKLALEHGGGIPSPFPTGAQVSKAASTVGWLAAAAAAVAAAWHFGWFKSSSSA